MEAVRARQIIIGLIVLAIPSYIFLAGCLGMENAFIIMLAVATFVIVRRYIKRRRDFNSRYRQTKLANRL